MAKKVLIGVVVMGVLISVPLVVAIRDSLEPEYESSAVLRVDPNAVANLDVVASRFGQPESSVTGRDPVALVRTQSRILSLGGQIKVEAIPDGTSQIRVTARSGDHTVAVKAAGETCWSYLAAVEDAVNGSTRRHVKALEVLRDVIGMYRDSKKGTAESRKYLRDQFSQLDTLYTDAQTAVELGMKENNRRVGEMIEITRGHRKQGDVSRISGEDPEIFAYLRRMHGLSEREEDAKPTEYEEFKKSHREQRRRDFERFLEDWPKRELERTRRDLESVSQQDAQLAQRGSELREKYGRPGDPARGLNAEGESEMKDLINSVQHRLAQVRSKLVPVLPVTLVSPPSTRIDDLNAPLRDNLSVAAPAVVFGVLSTFSVLGYGLVWIGGRLRSGRRVLEPSPSSRLACMHATSSTEDPLLRKGAE